MRRLLKGSAECKLTSHSSPEDLWRIQMECQKLVPCMTHIFFHFNAVPGKNGQNNWWPPRTASEGWRLRLRNPGSATTILNLCVLIHVIVPDGGLIQGNTKNVPSNPFLICAPNFSEKLQSKWTELVVHPEGGARVWEILDPPLRSANLK